MTGQSSWSYIPACLCMYQIQRKVADFIDKKWLCERIWSSNGISYDHRAESQLKACKVELADLEFKLDCLRDVLQKAKLQLENVQTPHLEAVLSRIDQTIQSHEDRLLKLQLSFEIKKNYAIEELRMDVDAILSQPATSTHWSVGRLFVCIFHSCNFLGRVVYSETWLFDRRSGLTFHSQLARNGNHTVTRMNSRGVALNWRTTLPGRPQAVVTIRTWAPNDRLA